MGTGRMSFFSNRIKAQVLLTTRPLPTQMPMTLSSGLLTQQIDPRPPGGLRLLNVGFEFKSASRERTKVGSHRVDHELNQTCLLFTTLWQAHQWGFNCIQVRWDLERLSGDTQAWTLDPQFPCASLKVTAPHRLRPGAGSPPPPLAQSYHPRPHKEETRPSARWTGPLPQVTRPTDSVRKHLP